MVEERRRSVRVPLVVKVSMTRTDEEHYYFSKDISVGGMFIETREAFPVGNEVAVDFSIPVGDETQKISLTGEIVRTVSHETAQQHHITPGMGVRFASPPPEVTALLKDFIEELLVLRSGAG